MRNWFSGAAAEVAHWGLAFAIAAFWFHIGYEAGQEQQAQLRQKLRAELHARKMELDVLRRELTKELAREDPEI